MTAPERLTDLAARVLAPCACHEVLDCRKPPWVRLVVKRGVCYACSICKRFYGWVDGGKKAGGGERVADGGEETAEADAAG